MRHLDADDGWLRRAGGLTVDLECGWGRDSDGVEVLVTRLVSAARALGCTREPHDCRLAGRPNAPGLCRLAADLAASAPPECGVAATGGDEVSTFLSALGDAAGAVYFCRRVQHPAGVCWFSTAGAADDLCGRVLAASHTAAA